MRVQYAAYLRGIILQWIWLYVYIQPVSYRMTNCKYLHCIFYIMKSEVKTVGCCGFIFHNVYTATLFADRLQCYHSMD